MHLLDKATYSRVLDSPGVTLSDCCCYQDVGGNLVEHIRPLPWLGSFDIWAFFIFRQPDFDFC